MEEFRNLEFQEKRLKDAIENLDSKEEIKKALELAKKSHENQKRDEGDPYVIHLFRITNTLIYNLGIKDRDILIASLLHDIVEDTDITFEQVKEEFGDKVAEIVKALTRDKDKETKEEKFKKTLESSEAIIILKAADWLDNIRSLVYRTDREDRWQRHLRETEQMYIPLAKASGQEYLIEEIQKALETAKNI